MTRVTRRSGGPRPRCPRRSPLWPHRAARRPAPSRADAHAGERVRHGPALGQRVVGLRVRQHHVQAAVGRGMLVGELPVVGKDERRVRPGRRAAVEQQGARAVDADLRRARRHVGQRPTGEPTAAPAAPGARSPRVSWCCGMPAVTSAGVPVRIGSRPPGIVGQGASAPSGTGFSPWARRWSRRSASHVPTSPTTLPASWSPPLRALGPTAARRSPSPASPRCGPAAALGCGCRRCRVRGTPACPRAVRASSGRPRRAATRRRATPRPPSGAPIGEHQGARDRHALAEAHEQDRDDRDHPRCRARRGTTLRSPRGSPGRGGRRSPRTSGNRLHM